MKSTGMSDVLVGWDPVWEKLFQQQEWGKYPPEHVIRFVARSFYDIPDRKCVRLLDLGCGPGACAWYMAREGFDVCGIDGSPTAITRARRRLESEGTSADLRTGDFTTLPWPGASFDGIVDNVSIHSNPIEPMRKVIAEVHRCLKPGGLFLSACFTDRTWGYGTGPCVEPGGFAQVREGPLAGKGFCRFAGRPQIQDFYGNFQIISLETLSYTLDNMNHTIELWIVTCQKPSDSP